MYAFELCASYLWDSGLHFCRLATRGRDLSAVAEKGAGWLCYRMLGGILLDVLELW